MAADDAVSIHRERTHVSRTDFRRDVQCVLGLPVDAVHLHGTIGQIVTAAAAGRRCLLSTPNLNILLGSHKDPAYRDSLIRTDLSIPDGAPLVWIARLLGIPIRRRVAGSNLFEALVRGEGGPLKVYFFGGPEGAARTACDHLNAMNGALRCVGSMSPGFGTIAEMSKPHMIEHINRSGADFLIVAIAARKAQLWIEHNQRALGPPVMGALGALVNFVSGRISRAPVLMQRLGLEWLWRIKEEPALWKRYASDGLTLLRLLITRVLPGIAWRLWDILGGAGKTGRITVRSDETRTLLTLRGSWVDAGLHALRETLENVTATPADIDLDLSGLERMDHSCIALLMLLYGHQSKIERAFRIVSISHGARWKLKLNCAEFLLARAPNPPHPRVLR